MTESEVCSVKERGEELSLFGEELWRIMSIVFREGIGELKAGEKSWLWELFIEEERRVLGS